MKAGVEKNISYRYANGKMELIVITKKGELERKLVEISKFPLIITNPREEIEGVFLYEGGNTLKDLNGNEIKLEESLKGFKLKQAEFIIEMENIKLFEEFLLKVSQHPPFHFGVEVVNRGNLLTLGEQQGIKVPYKYLTAPPPYAFELAGVEETKKGKVFIFELLRDDFLPGKRIKIEVEKNNKKITFPFEEARKELLKRVLTEWARHFGLSGEKKDKILEDEFGDFSSKFTPHTTVFFEYLFWKTQEGHLCG